MATTSNQPDAVPEPTAASQPSDKVNTSAAPNPPTAQSPPQASTSSQSQQKKHDQSPPLRPQPSSPVGGKSYYGYLFKKDRTETPLLDALLRAIAGYIASNMGEKSGIGLDPKKLAAFYHAVGGDYDTLFLNAPNESISYIWRALGVQHILQQPVGQYFVEPTIPALTFEGFSRWESIQILLEPQEHAPFIQYAVRNWALKHPETGEPFPVDLPRDSFPPGCDPEIDKWHKSCAERLRREAAVPEQPPPPPPGRDPRVHAGFSHVHGPQVNAAPPHRRRPEMDYFSRERPTLYSRVVPPPPTTRHPGSHHSSPYSGGHRRVRSNSSDEPRRRRSFSDLKQPPGQNVRFSERLDPRPSAPPRRHSQPRHYSSPSTSSSASSVSSESDSEVRARSRPTSASRLYTHVSPAPAIRRGPPPPSVTAVPPRSSHRPVSPPVVGTQRRSLVGEVKHKITSLLPGSHDRHRSSSREYTSGGGGGGAPVRPRYATTRTTPPPMRRTPGWSDGSYPSPSDDDSDNISPKSRDRDRDRIHRGDPPRPRPRPTQTQSHSHSHSHSHNSHSGGSGRDRDRERERAGPGSSNARRSGGGGGFDREHERDRARDEERDRRNRRDITNKAYLRPATGDRRPSSHADAERRQRERERERDREYAATATATATRERERGRGGSDYERGRSGGGRRLATSSAERERERASRRWKERGPSPVVTGVGGRRYAGPTAAAAAAAAAGGAGGGGSEPPWN